MTFQLPRMVCCWARSCRGTAIGMAATPTGHVPICRSCAGKPYQQEIGVPYRLLTPRLRVFQRVRIPAGFGQAGQIGTLIGIDQVVDEDPVHGDLVALAGTVVTDSGEQTDMWVNLCSRCGGQWTAERVGPNRDLLCLDCAGESTSVGSSYSPYVTTLSA